MNVALNLAIDQLSLIIQLRVFYLRDMTLIEGDIRDMNSEEERTKADKALRVSQEALLIIDEVASRQEGDAAVARQVFNDNADGRKSFDFAVVEGELKPLFLT